SSDLSIGGTGTGLPASAGKGTGTGLLVSVGAGRTVLGGSFPGSVETFLLGSASGFPPPEKRKTPRKTTRVKPTPTPIITLFVWDGSVALESGSVRAFDSPWRRCAAKCEGDE